MTLPRSHRSPTPGLVLGLAFAFTIFPSLVQAQPLSSGSGAGTGTGAMGGTSRNTTGTGMESSSRHGTGTGDESGTGPDLFPSNSPMFRSSGPLGGYGRDRFPTNPPHPPMDNLLPSDNVSSLSYVTERQLDYAKRLLEPTDRSLALSRIASAATFSGQLDLAEGALNDATTAAMEVQPGLVRDQRMISIIYSLMNLAEARLREPATAPTDNEPGVPPPPAPASDTPPPKPTGPPAATPPASPTPLPKKDTNDLIRKAAADWKRAVVLAEQIDSRTFKSEMMYRVADSMASGSRTIIMNFPSAKGGSVTAAGGVNQSYAGLPDQLLQTATETVLKISRPVWRDRGLVAVAGSAAESKQFARAIAIARQIPQPEVRTDGLIKVADLQARKGDEKGATETYREAAEAVASIPLDDPRAVLAGVLIDDLIAVGRFEDARFSVVLYPDAPRRLVALGAIAEAQGKRGAAASALKWIKDEIPAEYQSLLYRKVNNGVVSAIETNRSRDLSGGNAAGRGR